MSMVPMVEYADAEPRVHAVCDAVMATRKTDWINNFWKVLASHPTTPERMRATIREVMGSGALDPLTRDLVCVASPTTTWPGAAVRRIRADRIGA